MVFGPFLCGTPGTSADIPRSMMNHEMKMIPNINIPMVDVRDVAEAHLKAMLLPEASGNRHILYTDGIWLRDIAKCLDKEFSSQGYNIPVLKAPYFTMWCLSFFNSKINKPLKNVGKVFNYDNTRMKNYLGIVPISVDDTIIDMAYMMVEKGHCKRTTNFKPRAPATSTSDNS